MRLIDADVLKPHKQLEPMGNGKYEYVEVVYKDNIDDSPTIEVEPKWIPCSERLPDYNETSEYLITDKEGRLRHCLLDPYMPETFVTVEEGMIVDAVAWRPAPEPYCKTESHEREVE